MKKLATAFSLFTLLLLAVSCKKEFKYHYYTEADTAILNEYLNLPELPDDYTVNLPNHLSNVGLFARPVERDKAVLGRVLFYDKKLSKDQTVSCASCHKQNLAFSDDKPFSDGVYDRSTARNSIALGSVANFSAYYGTDLNGSSAIRFFWDNRAETAADQSRGSMTNEKEMDMQMHEIADVVRNQPYYAPLFKMAFGDANVSQERVLEAVANFVNSMGSYQSQFDSEASKSPASYVQGASFNVIYDQPFSGLTASQNKGKQLYNANCASCHSGNMGRPVLQLANNGLESSPTDLGVGGISGIVSQNGSFKVPTLRNITLTAPYMHDGRFQNLEQVLEFYNTGIQSHPDLSLDLQTNGQPKRMNFSDTDKQDILAFLGTLTDSHILEDIKFSDPFKQ